MSRVLERLVMLFASVGPLRPYGESWEKRRRYRQFWHHTEPTLRRPHEAEPGPDNPSA